MRVGTSVFAQLSVSIRVCKGGDHTSMGKSALFPVSSHKCECGSVLCVDQSKVTVSVDA